MVSHFYCLFSYHSLLGWHYGDRRSKTVTIKELANAEGLSIQEIECHMDVDMFLDEYQCWDAGGLHCLLNLQEIFLHATHMGRREAE